MRVIPRVIFPSFGIMKKIILLCSLVVLGTAAAVSNHYLSEEVAKPATVNVPDNLYTDGNVGTPYDFEPFHEDGEEFWTIINNSGCPVNYRQWFSGHDNSGGLLSSNFSAGVLGSTMGSSTVLTYGDVRGLFPGVTVSTINYAIFEFNIPPSAVWAPIGVGSHDVNTGLPSPCNCINITMNPSTRTVVISRGFSC